MRLNRLGVSAGIAFSLASAWMWAQETTAPDAKATRKNDPKIVEKVRGDYVLKAGKVNGLPMTADRLANVSAKVTEQTITTYDGQRQQRFSASYQISGEKAPWSVTLKSVKKIEASDGSTKREKVEEAEGILDLADDGQKLLLAYATDGGERPKILKAARVKMSSSSSA